jgi:hypothetical protein
MNTNNNGTYVAVRFSEGTADKLHEYATSHNVPNRLEASEYHSTVVYSRNKLKNISLLRELSPNWIGYPTGFDVFDSTENGQITKCLVMKFSCVKLEARHVHLVEYNNATHDFPTYEAHISLSYDIGDFDIDLLGDIKSFLPEILITHEFSEELKDVGRTETKEESQLQS